MQTPRMLLAGLGKWLRTFLQWVTMYRFVAEVGNVGPQPAMMRLNGSDDVVISVPGGDSGLLSVFHRVGVD